MSPYTCQNLRVISVVLILKLERNPSIVLPYENLLLDYKYSEPEVQVANGLACNMSVFHILPKKSMLSCVPF